MVKNLIILSIFSLGALARLEWPGEALEGDACTLYYEMCAEGLGCDTRYSENRRSGFCAKRCQDSKDCPQDYQCDFFEKNGFCYPGQNMNDE